MPIRAVILDVEGTLLDEATEYEALDRAMADAAEKYGLEASPADLSGEFNLALMEVIRSEGDPYGGDDEGAQFVPFEHAAGEIFGALLEFRGFSPTPEDKTWYWTTYVNHLRRQWRAYPEVRKVLTELKEKDLRLVAVTDADKALAKEMIPRMRLDGLIDDLVCAEDVGFVKPHTILFERAITATSAPAEECVMVGDSYERDVVGARGAGVGHAVLVDRHGARTVDVPTIASLKRLPRVIEKLQAES